MSKKDFHTELKSGFTTGTCSAAVAKACTYMLVHQQLVHHINVRMPDGSESTLEICEPQFNENSATCYTIKDAGDDPDATHHIKIYATATHRDEPGFELTTGPGIGMVTKPGLAVEVGKPAINPVPLKMIHQAIAEVIDDEGVKVELSIPEGVEIAKKTFNPQLGIVGGISVLGTTGVVKPMSEEALKSSLELSLKQLAALGHDEVILVPGNYAVSFLKKYYDVPDKLVVQTSNFIGFMLEKAVKHGFKKIVLVGHIGKLVKLAAGIFYTHSRIADARNEVMTAHYLKYSNDASTAIKLMDTNTTEEAVDIIKDANFWNYMAYQIKHRANKYIYNETEIEVITFSQSKGLLGKSVGADNHIELLKANSKDQKVQSKQSTISICGIGPGNPDFILPEVYKEIAKADIIIAGKRHLELVENSNKEKLVFTGYLDQLQTDITENKNKYIVVLVSGDTGFHSLRRFIMATFAEENVKCIPGISSFQYLYAKMNMSYEKAHLASLHGTEFNFVDALKKYESVFLLTDRNNNYKTIAQTLIDNNMPNAHMIIGSRLSYENEQIETCTASEAIHKDFDANLCSIIIKAQVKSIKTKV